MRHTCQLGRSLGLPRSRRWPGHASPSANPAFECFTSWNPSLHALPACQPASMQALGQMALESFYPSRTPVPRSAVITTGPMPGQDTLPLARQHGLAWWRGCPGLHAVLPIQHCGLQSYCQTARTTCWPPSRVCWHCFQDHRGSVDPALPRRGLVLQMADRTLAGAFAGSTHTANTGTHAKYPSRFWPRPLSRPHLLHIDSCRLPSARKISADVPTNTAQCGPPRSRQQTVSRGCAHPRSSSIHQSRKQAY